VALLQKPESAWVDAFAAVPELDQYVRRESVPPVHRTADPRHAWMHLKPLSLNLWLQRRALAEPHAGAASEELRVLVAGKPLA
jgi:hypothetical protein